MTETPWMAGLRGQSKETFSLLEETVADTCAEMEALLSSVSGHQHGLAAWWFRTTQVDCLRQRAKLWDKTQLLLRCLRRTLVSGYTRQSTTAVAISTVSLFSRQTKETHMWVSPSTKSCDFINKTLISDWMLLTNDPLEKETIDNTLPVLPQCPRSVKACVPAYVDKEQKDVRRVLKHRFKHMFNHVWAEGC